MSPLASLEPITASPAEVPAIRKIVHEFIESGRPKLVMPNGEVLDLPESVFQLLGAITTHLAKGEVVTIVPQQKMLSTQEAADILGVSRPHFIKLLNESQEEPDAGRRLTFTMVGNRRRIRFDDLMKFKRAWDAQRLAAMDELVELSEELGLYEPEQR